MPGVVGHFNSDAAARDGLAEEIGALQLCAPDEAQVIALIRACRGDSVSLIHDDTAYAKRLVRAFSNQRPADSPHFATLAIEACRTAPDTEALVLLGTHVAIRDALRRWYADAKAEPDRTPRFLACDDCSIDAFMDGIPAMVTVQVATPQPDYEAATRTGVTLAIDAIIAAPGRETAYLRACGLFDTAGESKDAGFLMVERSGNGQASDG